MSQIPPRLPRHRTLPFFHLATFLILACASPFHGQTSGTALPPESILWMNGSHLFTPTFVEFSPDSTLLFTASGDGGTKVWDFESATHIRTFFPPQLGRFGDANAALSLDRTWVAASSFESNAIRVFRLNDGGNLHVLTNAPRFISSLSLSDDAEWLAVGDVFGGLRIWDVRGGRPLEREFATSDGRVTNGFHTARFVTGTQFVAFAADEFALFDLNSSVPVWRRTNTLSRVFGTGERTGVIVLGNGRQLSIHRLRDGSLTTSWETADADVSAVRLSPDESWLAVGNWSGRIEVRHVETGAVAAARSNGTGRIDAIGWSLDQRWLAVAAVDGLRAHRWQATDPPRIFYDSPGIRTALARSADGERLYAGASNGQVELLRADDGGRLLRWSATVGRVNILDHSPTADLLVTEGTANGELRLWDSVTGRLMATNQVFQSPVDRAAFSSDGTRVIAVQGGQFAILRVPEWKVLLRSSASPVRSIRRIIWSPRGDLLAALMNDGTIALMDSGSGTARPPDFTPPGAGPVTIQFLNGGDVLASIGPDGLIAYWNVGTQSLLRSVRIDSANFSNATFTPDENLIVIHEAGTVAFYRADTGRRLTVLSHETGGLLYNLLFDAAGDRLFFGRLDGSVVAVRMPFYIRDARLQDGFVRLEMSGLGGRFQVEGRQASDAVWRALGPVQDGPHLTVPIESSSSSALLRVRKSE